MSKSDPQNVGDRTKAAMSEIERAFAEILDATEQSVHAIRNLDNTAKGPGATADLITIVQDANARILSACSSQDVIRQHLDILAKQLATPAPDPRYPKDDEKLLAGPQIDGQGLKQEDIDAMFD